jgi:hypothetical protein
MSCFKKFEIWPIYLIPGRLLASAYLSLVVETEKGIK